MVAARHTLTGRLDGHEPDWRLADEPIEQPDGVRPAADAGDDEVGQAALHLSDLRRGLVTDDPLEVAHDRRVGVRAHRRTEHVVRVGDVRHPVAHGVVDRVLQRRRAGVDRPHLGAERLHAQHVGPLALDVARAHVDDARDAEQRAGGGRRHAVLAGAGLGDDARLAQPARAAPGRVRC
jgi:hypothetical protein